MNNKDKTIGIYDKYSVYRTDGKSHDPEDKFFVLNYGKCPHAEKAILTFADSVRFENPKLAKDIYDHVYGKTFNRERPPNGEEKTND